MRSAPKFANLAGVAAIVSAAAVASCETEPATGISFPKKLGSRTFVGAGPRIKFVFVKVREGPKGVGFSCSYMC
eukprot:scaffold576_cov260-Pinguiococcus_pyrenoidosus.AAC.89